MFIKDDHLIMEAYDRTQFNIQVGDEVVSKPGPQSWTSVGWIHAIDSDPLDKTDRICTILSYQFPGIAENFARKSMEKMGQHINVGDIVLVFNKERVVVKIYKAGEINHSTGIIPGQDVIQVQKPIFFPSLLSELELSPAEKERRQIKTNKANMTDKYGGDLEDI